jgi:site-specific DNA recombinase
VERGIHAPGGRWQQTNFRTMITSPRLCAHREYHGVLTPGDWPAIIPLETTLQLRHALNGNHVATARSYLLSGMCRCGICGGRLVSRPRANGARRYVCAKGVEGTNCGKIARMAEPIEALVKESIFVALEGVDLTPYASTATDTTAATIDAIEADEAALQELANDHYVLRRIGKSEYFHARDALQRRLDANQCKLSHTNGRSALDGYAGAGERLRGEWDGLNLDQRRAIIAALVDHVEVLPQSSSRFDPEMIQILWRY